MSLKKMRYPLSKQTMPLTYKIINQFPLKYNKKKFHNICQYSLQCIYLSTFLISRWESGQPYSQCREMPRLKVNHWAVGHKEHYSHTNVIPERLAYFIAFLVHCVAATCSVSLPPHHKPLLTVSSGTVTGGGVPPRSRCWRQTGQWHGLCPLGSAGHTGISDLRALRYLGRCILQARGAWASSGLPTF